MISGATIIRNGLSGGIPFAEAICAVLPICDEFIVGDDSTDGTKEELEKLAKKYPKIRIIDTPWPLKEHRENSISYVTNQVLEQCKGDFTIAPQGDEVLGEGYLSIIKEVMESNQYDGIVFNRVQIGRNFQEYHHSGVPADFSAPQGLIRAGRTRTLKSGGDGLGMSVGSENLFEFKSPAPNIQLWDISKCFVHNFPYRSKNCAEIWWHIPDNNRGAFYNRDSEEWFRQIEEWDRVGYPGIYEATASPLQELLPKILHPLIGVKKYYVREEL